MLLLFLSPQVVRERLVCRTIVDGHSSYEHVHSVDVSCRFMSSLISLSPGKMEFYTEKVGEAASLAALISLEIWTFYSCVALQALGQDLQPIFEKLVLNNVSSQSLSVELSLTEPFSLCEAPDAFSSASTKVRLPVSLVFTPASRNR